MEELLSANTVHFIVDVIFGAPLLIHLHLDSFTGPDILRQFDRIPENWPIYTQKWAKPYGSIGT